jgi:hypothetical protein
MTEESHMPETPEGAAPAPAEPSAGSAAAAAMSEQFSTGEGMVAVAGWILVAEYLVMGVLMNQYWVPWLMLIPAIGVVILPRFREPFTDKIAPLSTVLKTLGYLIALVGVIVIIEDIRFAGSRFDDAWYIIGSLILYGAAALAFLGARSIKN